MSTTPPVAGPAAPAVVPPAERRVREQARDAVVLMVFSGVLSLTVAVAALLLARLGQ